MLVEEKDKNDKLSEEIQALKVHNREMIRNEEEQKKAAGQVTQSEKEQNHGVQDDAGHVWRRSSNEIDSASQKAIPRSASLFDYLEDATMKRRAPSL